MRIGESYILLWKIAQCIFKSLWYSAFVSFYFDAFFFETKNDVEVQSKSDIHDKRQLAPHAGTTGFRNERLPDL